MRLLPPGTLIIAEPGARGIRLSVNIYDVPHVRQSVEYPRQEAPISSSEVYQSSAALRQGNTQWMTLPELMTFGRPRPDVQRHHHQRPEGVVL